MASAVVTGCAGFIGSHLTEALLEDGHTVLGVDCFNDNYARADKRANLERANDYDGFRLLTADLDSIDATALLDGADVVYHLAGEPGVRAELGPALRPLHAPQRRRPRNGCSRPRRDTHSLRFVYASSSSDLRRRAHAPHPRGRDAAPALPLRRDQARRRAPVRALRRGARRRHRRPALLQRLRPAPAARHGLPPLLRGDRRRRADRALRRRPPDARLHLRRRHRRRDPRRRRDRHAARAASSTSAAATAPASTARSRSSPGSPGARSTSAAATASPATCRTPAPTPSAPARSSASLPPPSLEDGLAAELDWVQRAHAARAAGAQLDRFLTFPAPRLERALRYPGCAPLQPESKSP